jgi:hypothetical protein
LQAGLKRRPEPQTSNRPPKTSKRQSPKTNSRPPKMSQTSSHPPKTSKSSHLMGMQGVDKSKMVHLVLMVLYTLVRV